MGNLQMSYDPAIVVRISPLARFASASLIEHLLIQQLVVDR